ncbi:MAG: SDR family NAD(P)-dependent oxidoreductase [Rhodospirillales bacterium]|nr:SDR family NAD(P)-dependent oxidoreductase [Rhodospirillales bacterium]
MSDPLTVLVIGASRGLGLALAEEWLKRGAKVIATVRGTPGELTSLMERYPERLAVEGVDIAHGDQVRALRQRLEARSIDILYINAGIARAIESTPAEADEQDFLDMMLVNALSPVRAAFRNPLSR